MFPDLQSGNTVSNCYHLPVLPTRGSDKTYLHLLQARGQNLPAGGAKTRRVGHIFKIQYWMYAATGGPNVKWGGQAPLTTALTCLHCEQAYFCVEESHMTKHIIYK